MPKIVLTIAALAIVALPDHLTARQAERTVVAEAADLTIETAIELARGHNPDLRRVAHAVDRAAAVERAGWGAFLPELSASASLNEFSSRTLTARNEFGEPVALEDPARISGASASGSINASLTVFSGFRRGHELRAARAGGEAAAASEIGELARIEAEVRRRFHTVLGAERQLAVEERLLAQAEERLAAMRAMVSAGRATPHDVLGAEADVARQEMALENARTGVYTSKLLLREIVGVDLPPDIRVVGDFPALVDLGGLDEEAFVADVMRRSPRVHRAEAAAAMAGHTESAVRATRMPTIRLNAGMDRGISLPAANQITDFPWNRGFGVGISASVPLFTGFALSERVIRASTATGEAEEDARRMRLAVDREARAALAEARTAYRSVELAERASTLAQQRLAAGQEGFGHGRISFTELQQLIDRAALAERSAVSAWMNYARAIATLREVAGGELDI